MVLQGSPASGGGAPPRLGGGSSQERIETTGMPTPDTMHQLYHTSYCVSGPMGLELVSFTLTTVTVLVPEAD